VSAESATLRISELGVASQPGQAERRYGLSQELVAALGVESPRLEAIRGLRAHIVTQHLNRGRRALAVCSPNTGAGCTFVAANLAVSLSQIGLKTILIDADLKRPSIGELIRPPVQPVGLAHALTDPGARISDCIDANVLPDLSVMYAGTPGAHPRDLLSAERFRALMNVCLRDFDVTIVDTPAANLSPDARRISSVVGYALIVAGRNRTFVRDVKTLIEQLKSDRASVIGTVLYDA